MLDYWPNLLTLLGVVAVGGMTVWGNNRVSQRAARASNTGADAAMTTAIAQGFKGLTEELQEELRSARREITELRGEIRDLTQHVSSLEEFLRRNGLAVPKRPHRKPSLAVVDGGEFGAEANP